MLPRFLQLPATAGKHFIVFLDDVIRDNLHEIFRDMKSGIVTVLS
ncbi:MAG: hypothetical protein HC867_02815 [Bacteroidia bacterium]|nr:hypothetical protein [Bacteroidia bacterium]